MPKTTAQRQAEYRRRRATAGDNGERRVNTWVCTAAALALERLARREGLTQRAMLERLILSADADVLEGLRPDTPGWTEYFYGALPRNVDSLPAA